MKAPKNCAKDSNMNTWTNAARSRLEEYFGRVRPDLEAAGADVDEVAQDIRRHVENEAAAMQLGVVTEQDVGAILGRIGLPEPRATERSVRTQAVVEDEEPASEPPPKIHKVGMGLLVFGVILPLVAISFECVTGICAAVLFDPYPTIAHLLITILVPLTNLWLWMALRSAATLRIRAMAWASGAAIGISAFYGLLLLPFSPFAFIGLIYAVGLIPLSPYLALWSTWKLRKHAVAQAGVAMLPKPWVGALLAVAVLLVLSAPVLLTEVGLKMAVSDETDVQNRGLWLLRTGGSQEGILRACYGRTGGLGEMYSFGGKVTPEQARRVYYQVFARPFNSVAPPKLYVGRARWSVIEDDFAWDNGQAGDEVAGRVKGLSLAGSRQDVIIEPDSGTAYCEWTIEFKNVAPRQREARAQMLLPPGAVVSRLTLWISGEEREAAFGGRDQVKTAYKEVVTARRDPVLVTTSGPDRVLVQCFPVPPSGGTMKARIGITAPLQMAGLGEGLLRLPAFIERNFAMADSVSHSVWVDSRSELRAGNTNLLAGADSVGRFSLRGDLSDRELAGSAVITVKRRADAPQIWARDTRNADGTVVIQNLVTNTLPQPGMVVLVVDGAKHMETHRNAIARALATLPAQQKMALLLAHDGVHQLVLPDAQDATNAAVNSLRRAQFSGGQDNAPALIRAWDLASQYKNGTVVWLHASQPEAFEGLEVLRQRFERRPGEVRLISLQADAGPNRVLEKLDGCAGVESLMRRGSIEQDLRLLFSGFAGSSQLTFARERKPQPADTVQSAEGSDHIVRLWAADEARRLQAKRRVKEAMAVACTYQLVTPVSGAVVLETQEQFKKAGLEPAPASTVPMIPEPSSLTLVLFAAGLAALRKRLLARRST